MSPFPCGPQDLPPSWLTEAMGHVMATGTSISDLTWDIIGKEWGFTGVVAHVYLQALPGVDGPDSLVATFPAAARESPSHYQQRQALDEVSWLRSYERSAWEVDFYHQIVSRGRLPAPRLYLGAADADSRCIVLLLEDWAATLPGMSCRAASLPRPT